MTINQMILKLLEVRNKYGGEVPVHVFAPDEFNNGIPVESPAIISECKDDGGHLLSLAIVEPHWNPHESSNYCSPHYRTDREVHS